MINEDTSTVYSEMEYEGFTIVTRNLTGVPQYSVDEGELSFSSCDLEEVKTFIDDYITKRDRFFRDFLDDDYDWYDDYDGYVRLLNGD